MNIRIEYVEYMPKVLSQGVLYVSREFNTAAHLCPCGCGSKIRTPLTPTEWRLTVNSLGPTLRPSIGNWQLPCRSHYLITNGSIVWSNQWTDVQIAAGAKREDARRRRHFAHAENEPETSYKKLGHWIKNLFR